MTRKYRINQNKNKMVNIDLIKYLDCNNVESLKPYAFYLCKNFLGKAWSQFKINDFTIEKLR